MNWTAKFGILLIALALVLVACSDINEMPALPTEDELQTAIVYGEVDTDEAYSNVGAFIGVGADGSTLFQVCSGTLIHPQVFLTAGHCTVIVDIFGIPVEYVKVNFDLQAFNEATLLDVAQVITHPLYGSESFYANAYDVGVLILEEPITDITPATVTPLGFLDELRDERKLRHRPDATTFTVVGYGVQDRRAGFPWDGLRRVAESEFLNLRKAWLHLSQNEARGNSGTCYGDSGGPTFYTQGDGSQVLVSVTSWGDRPCVATGTTYRLDIPESQDFINTVIQSLSES